MKEAIVDFGDFKIEGRIINKARFTDDMEIIAKAQGENRL